MIIYSGESYRTRKKMVVNRLNYIYNRNFLKTPNFYLKNGRAFMRNLAEKMVILNEELDRRAVFIICLNFFLSVNR